MEPKRNDKRASYKVGDTLDYKKLNGKVQKATVMRVDPNSVLIRMNSDGEQKLVSKSKVKVTFS